MAAGRSFKGMQVVFGILGTIAAVVVMFAYAVSDDIYRIDSSEIPEQSSAQFSSAVSGEGEFEEAPSPPREATPQSDTDRDSMIPPIVSIKPLPAGDTSAPNQNNGSQTTVVSEAGNQNVERTLTESAHVSVSEAKTTYHEVQANDESVEQESKQSVGVAATPAVKNVAATRISDNDNDDQRQLADEDDDEPKVKKHKHEKDQKDHGKGKGHHKD